VVVQELEQSVGFFFLEADNVGCEAGVYVERLFAGYRVYSDDGVLSDLSDLCAKERKKERERERGRRGNTVEARLTSVSTRSRRSFEP
jgi:hypothetical protein